MTITRFEFNRSQLATLLPENSLAIVASGTEKIRNRDCEFPFRVDSNFWYLTGFDEPNSLLVIETSATGYSSIIFVRPKNKNHEIWTGVRLGTKNAPCALGVDKAFDTNEFTKKLGRLIKGKDYVFTLFSQKRLGQTIQSYLADEGAGKNFGELFTKWHDLSVHLHQLRLIKTDEEVQLMRQAAMISSLGHMQMMRACKPDRYEYQLAAVMHYESTMQGAQCQAYNPIVASGANACILHYNANNSQMKSGDLVLIDAGCEYQYYASDITRTFPVNARFSGWQLDLYNLVLEAQQAAINACQAGNKHEDIHLAATKVICTAIADLGLLKENAEEIFAKKLYSRYFMHGTSHWLGLDVHDVGNYKNNDESTQLEVAMVITVEPGFYIAADDTNAPPQWRGTGIRIEDDILITKDKPEILTLATPKKVNDIQDIVGLASGRRA